MSSFRSKWEDIGSEWGAEVDERAPYLEYLEHLASEGLPQHTERVRSLTNKFGTQSLTGLQQAIKSECENIRDRIDMVNQVMRRVEFRTGSYLELQARQLRIPKNDEFDRRVEHVKQLAVVGNERERFLALQEVVLILRKATDSNSAGTLESRNLLDPRHRFDFLACEQDRETNTPREVWSSTGGKSGGEKESFSGMIVAASLAYVLSPQGSPRPVYSTVWLDEAFSNTSSGVSERVIRAFRELKLHLNLVTPFKNIDIARDCARSIIMVKLDEIDNTSHLSQVTWEYIDRMNGAGDVLAQANQCGVTVEEAPT